MRNLIVAAAASAFLALGANAALADECSGHSHDTGTALGAVGGAAIGGLASHSVVGAVAGGVVGGFAGNAIARSSDCDAERHAEMEDRRDAAANENAYAQGYQDRAVEDRQAYNYPD
jgi:uncharacterized protein YcfJ